MKKTELLQNLFFPPRCPVCDQVLWAGEKTCGPCGTKIQHITEPCCKKCGKPLEDERREYCPDCAHKKHFYTQGKAVFVYQGGIRESMYRFKYANKREYATFYAEEAYHLHGAWIRAKGIEVILPVPMYRKKERKRGYNQAAVFARSLGKISGIPVDQTLLSRVRNTVPQKELNDKERRKNLEEAFVVSGRPVPYHSVLLVDDIYTTGSTVDAIAEILRAEGVDVICFLSISIGAGF